MNELKDDKNKTDNSSTQIVSQSADNANITDFEVTSSSNSVHNGISNGSSNTGMNVAKENQEQTSNEQEAESSCTLPLPCCSNSCVMSKQISSSDSQLDKENEERALHRKETPHSIETAVYFDSDNSVNLSPENKLLEVILKEEDDSGSMLQAFEPEVHCSIEEAESIKYEDNGSILEKGSELGLVMGEVVSAVKESGIDLEGIAADVDVEKDASLDIHETSAHGTDETSQPAASNPEDMQRTYIADFLCSDASNVGLDQDAYGSEENKKGLPLFRFPKIVKSLAKAEYSLLQELYKLIYIRNPWDTIEILSKRILDFSGFNFSQDSEDYFTRRVMLRTMPQNTLESIAKLLCLEYKPVSPDDAEERQELETYIMQFLHIPHRRLRSATIKLKGSKNIPPSKSKSSSAVRAKSRKRKRNLSNPERKGSKSSKLNVSKTQRNKKYVEETIDVEESSLDVENGHNSGTGTEFNLKMKLEGTSKQGFRLVPADDIPESEQETMKKPVGENHKNPSASEGDSNGKLKLQDFPEILSNVEGTPEKILKQIHYLLYLKDCEMDVLKGRILQFRGFSSDAHSKECEERKSFLEKMSNSGINNFMDTFNLMNQTDKDENIDLILEFLGAPDENLMKKAAEAPDTLLPNSKVHVGLSDSDDSICYEIVTKKVDCIDLVSSGDENEEEIKAKSECARKVEPKPEAQCVDAPKKRTLQNFETITKIVNTHPNEYLVDIYNLLYMLPSEPSTIRKEILDFSGFDFEKGTSEYLRRKQYLDRMQYNSVRRIFNTLIHNTREVRVFSKPTMIADIFQFLFKLPDTDTSIRQPPPKPNPLPGNASSPGLSMVSLAMLKAASGTSAVNSLLNQGNSKLSELKRVFQRVACFPCEYLIDVHKLLFMKDCEMTEIRQRIFAFKGFPFSVDSPEFKQRKLYLEYLTFHSLRKISSVLTTKNVDLRNSTKHELASHLTKILIEYTEMKPSDIDLKDPKGVNLDEACIKVASEKCAVRSTSGITLAATATGNTTGSSASSSVSVVPSIVEVCSEQPNLVDSLTLSAPNSTPVGEASALLPPENKRICTQVFARVISPTIHQVQNKLKTRTEASQPVSRGKSNQGKMIDNKISTSAIQFQDIHLPEVEKHVKNHLQDTAVVTLQRLRPKRIMSDQKNIVDVVRCNYRSIIEQKAHCRNAAPPYPVAISMPAPEHPLPFQFVSPYQTQAVAPNAYFPPSHSMLRPLKMFAKGVVEDHEADDCSESVPVECILTEGPDSGEPVAKKPAISHVISSAQIKPLILSTKSSANIAGNVVPNPVSKTASVAIQDDILHMKIRDAMTKGSEDEEDCDQPLAALVGHPNDKILKQQICGIVENTNLQGITINGVIQKIFNMYPKFNLNYRKDFIKSTLRSLLYRLGEEDPLKTCPRVKSPDSSTYATDPNYSLPEASASSSVTSK